MGRRPDLSPNLATLPDGPSDSRVNLILAVGPPFLSFYAQDSARRHNLRTVRLLRSRPRRQGRPCAASVPAPLESGSGQRLHARGESSRNRHGWTGRRFTPRAEWACWGKTLITLA